MLVVFAPEVELAIEIVPPSVSNRALPPVLPMVYAGSAEPEKVIFFMFSVALFMVIESIVLAPAKVAVSWLFVPEVEPGKVPAPVLQFVSLTVVTQLLFVGVALHVAEVAFADEAPIETKSASITKSTAAREAVRL